MTIDLKGQELLKAWDGKRSQKGYTQEQHAQELGIPYETYKARFYRAQANKRFAKVNGLDFDKSELFDVDKYKPLDICLKSFIAICDVHVPCTDYDYAMLPAQIAQKHMKKGQRVLIVHGDVFDGGTFSNWARIVKEPSWEQERQAAQNLFALWAETFDEIIILPGNHDYRMLKKLEGQASFGGMVWGMVDEQDKDLAQMFGSMFSTGKLQTSPVDHCFVDTPKGKYIVAHGTNYSINPLTVANEMAQKYQAHVISGHEHHAGMTIDRFGRYFIINNGGLFDKDKFAYVSLQASKRPVMKKGFTFVDNGHPTVFGDWTDWSKWL